MLNRYEKSLLLLLDIINAWEKLVIVFQKTLIVVCIIVKDLDFSLIWLITYIYLWMLKQRFIRAKIVFKSLMPEFNWSYSRGINLYFNF